MSITYETPRRECANCTGYEFPGGCANFCDIFDDLIKDDDFELDPSESRGECICDNCLTSTTGHCPGQLDCDKWHQWCGHNRAPVDEKQFEPRTIGFHLLDSDNN